MDYEHMIKYCRQVQGGMIITFDDFMRAKAASKGISYEEEVKNFESFKDSTQNISDAEYVMKLDEYEEIK